MYLVLELHGGIKQAQIMQEDEENATFDRYSDAEVYANENCQEGEIIPIGVAEGALDFGIIGDRSSL